jgi:FKBP-type peptidyl-prolyl cis-trans isomerase FklB
MTHLRKILVIFSLLFLATTLTTACLNKESADEASNAATASTPSSTSAPQSVSNTFDPENFNNAQIVSYNMGLRMGMYVNQGQFSGFDLDALILGVKDGAVQFGPRFSDERVQEATDAINEQMRIEHESAMIIKREENKIYLDLHAAKEGVSATPSGILYEVLESGEGASPKAESQVTVHYRGTLTDGTEFDSSIARGEEATFALNHVIPGWSEVLQLMKEGDKWLVTMPPEHAYGETSPSPVIPPNSILIFEIKLISVDS